jgi:hypothetical protein
MSPDRPKRRRPNADQKRQLKAADVRLFARQYARKAHAGHDPNDHRYSRETFGRVRHMRPEELARLLHDDEE